MIRKSVSWHLLKYILHFSTSFHISFSVFSIPYTLSSFVLFSPFITLNTNHITSYSSFFYRWQDKILVVFDMLHKGPTWLLLFIFSQFWLRGDCLFQSRMDHSHHQFLQYLFIHVIGCHSFTQQLIGPQQFCFYALLVTSYSRPVDPGLSPLPFWYIRLPWSISLSVFSYWYLFSILYIILH